MTWQSMKAINPPRAIHYTLALLVGDTPMTIRKIKHGHRTLNVYGISKAHKTVTTCDEHGEIFATCHECGASWAVRQDEEEECFDAEILDARDAFCV